MAPRTADPAGDPSEIFEAWYADAVRRGEPKPDAMTLATCSARGGPSARTVLLKDSRISGGMLFVTHLAGRKAADLAENPRACAVLNWPLSGRQVVAAGPVVRAPAGVAERLFRGEGRRMNLLAWASRQSSPVAARGILLRAMERAGRRFPGRVPVPPHWAAFRLIPGEIEFWRARRDAVHDRFRFTREGKGWRRERLAP